MNYSLHTEHLGIEGEYRIASVEQVKSNCDRYLRLNRLKRVENLEGVTLYEYTFEKEELLFIAKELCIDELKRYIGEDAVAILAAHNKPWEYLKDNIKTYEEDEEIYEPPYLSYEGYDKFFESIESPLRLAYVVGRLAEDLYNNQIPWVKIQCEEQEYLSHFYWQKTIEEEVQRHKFVLNIVSNYVDNQVIILPKSIPSNFCEKLVYTHTKDKVCIPIYKITNRGEINNTRVPLSGYYVEIDTEVKVYFTNAIEVVYTAYHIYRNMKDHRYQTKKIQSQHIEYFLINNDGTLVKVNRFNRSEYGNRLLDWEQKMEAIIAYGEISITALYELNDAIEKPFLKNVDYYLRMVNAIDRFVREGSYEVISNIYFLLGLIDEKEYKYHLKIGMSLSNAQNYMSNLDYKREDPEIIKKCLKLMAYFFRCLDIAPNAGILKVDKQLGKVFRSLIQIEKDRSYSVDFSSDDYLKERYAALVAGAK